MNPFVTNSNVNPHSLKMYYNALMGREQTSADIEDIDTSNYEKLNGIK